MTREQFNKHKEVIIWYMAEDGRTPLASYKGGTWVRVFEPTWQENLSYVQDDEYLEYRKALAEGKTIQYLNGTIDTDLPEDLWIDLDTAAMFTSYGTYRVKPLYPIPEASKPPMYIGQKYWAVGPLQSDDVEQWVYTDDKYDRSRYRVGNMYMYKYRVEEARDLLIKEAKR